MSRALASERRLAASVIVEALRSLQPLLDCRRTKEQYFEGVEAIIWIVSSCSDRYFDALDFDPTMAREKLDLSLYSDVALEIYPQMRESMYRCYVKLVRYSLQKEGERIPFDKIAIFAKDSVMKTEGILHQTKQKYNGKTEGKVPVFLDTLTKILETPLELQRTV